MTSPNAADWGQILDDMLEQGVRETDIHTTEQKVADRTAVLIDVREDREWLQRRIPGAVHIARGVLESRAAFEVPDRDTDLILYCHSGRRSIAAAASLLELGYSSVASMAGGIEAWQQAGLPIDMSRTQLT